MNSQRLETSRLFTRFGFGPRPGEYAQALIDGVSTTRSKVLTVPTVDAGAASVVKPEITDLGKRPEPNTKEIVPFAIAMRFQTQQMIMWWLDRMALSDNGLTEKMTWFWHGHWATSIQKLNYPLPMYKQNETLRTHCLGNFASMTKAMLNDGALQFWLDGQDSTVKAPNENLGRELMELFTLGVDRYTEDDVKSISRVLTGYQVNRNNGTVTINQNRRDKNPVNLLGTTAVFTGDSLADFLVARDDSAKFVSERLWYRFISSTEDMPATFSAKNAFATRDISAAVAAMANDSAMRDEKYPMVKSPVEWFVAVCRALSLTPSKMDSFTKLHGYLEKLSQVPFSPPNVGGWPTDEAWLSSASAQFRIAFATWLVNQADLSTIEAQVPAKRAAYIADLLAVVEWSPRTASALREVRAVVPRLVILAICSPEYVVSA